ncbi:MAG TPA: OmpH family outer membrane protein [Candidatus Baltobacteraceae bacterium]|nr:OmpH family outer membrane protein [Candidatus Baltobacteraceae bacterium]
MKKQLLLISLAAAILAGCANASPVGLVDVNRIVANWPVYQQFQQQLLLDEQAITQSKGSNAQKQREAAALQKKYAGITQELTSQIRDAATKVAQEKKLTLVVTKEGVGYGGVDITPDVEKVMNITDKASPSPG